jgi:pyruvate/2-oxoacid:ferredoxin oxidoreductase beta subunit
MDPGLSIKIAKEAISCRAFNLLEIENGVYTINMRPKKTPLKDYLFKQGRFKHMPDDLIATLERDLDAAFDRLVAMEGLTKPQAKEKGA